MLAAARSRALARTGLTTPRCFRDNRCAGARIGDCDRHRGNAAVGTSDTAQDTEAFTVTPVVAVTYYLGVSEDAVFAPADFTVMGGDPALTVPGAPAWPDDERRYIGHARPASLGDYTALYYYPPGIPNTFNRISAWMQESTTIMINGVECNVLRTRNSGRDTSRGRIVEGV